MQNKVNEMSFFIANALANTQDLSTQGSSMSLILVLLIFGLISYLMILLPQHRRAKAHKKLIDSVTKGNEVLTNGGLIGKVTKIIEGNYIVISVNHNTEVIIKRDFITAILPKDTMKLL